MLTVKICYHGNPSIREVLFEASCVEFNSMKQPNPPDMPRGSGEDAEIEFYNMNIAGLSITTPDGPQHVAFSMSENATHPAPLKDVYVMNDKGATVTKYTL